MTQAFGDSLNILLLDRSGSHTTKRLRLPEHVRLVFLPPYCPELNPIERLWRDVNDQFAWQQFSDVPSQQQAVAEAMCGYTAQTVQSLTGYAYLVDAIQCTLFIEKSYKVNIGGGDG